MLGTRLAKLTEPVNNLLRRLPLQVDALQRAALDLVVRPSKPVAVLAQDVVLVADALRVAEDVGSVRVLGDQPQRLLLATASDHDRHPRPRDGLRGVEEAGRRELFPLMAPLAAASSAPHLVRHLQRLLEHLEALAERREGEAEGARLFLVPGGPDPEPGAPLGQHVQRGGCLDP